MNRKSKRRLARSRRRYRNRHRSRPVEAHFPVVCDECGFKATCPADLQDHEHDEEQFKRPTPDHHE